MKNRLTKIFLALAVICVVFEVPWIFFTESLVDRTLVKTTATVINLHEEKRCVRTFISSRRRWCRFRKFITPEYEYFDQTGKRYEDLDRYLGEYQVDGLFSGLSDKYIGQKVTAYYTKNKPTEVTFMSGPITYTFWVIPLYLAALLSAIAGILNFRNIKRWLEGKSLG